jgi:hypothetical protein
MKRLVVTEIDKCDECPFRKLDNVLRHWSNSLDSICTKMNCKRIVITSTIPDWCPLQKA